MSWLAPELFMVLFPLAFGWRVLGVPRLGLALLYWTLVLYRAFRLPKDRHA